MATPRSIVEPFLWHQFNEHLARPHLLCTAAVDGCDEDWAKNIMLDWVLYIALKLFAHLLAH